MSENRILNILLYVMIIEIFLGGSGRVFNIPTRILVLLIMIVLTAIYIFKENIKIPKNLLVGIILLWAYCGFWVVLGIIKGNSIFAAIDDVTNFISIVYIIIILSITKFSKNAFDKIINIFKISMLILSVITIVLFVGSYLGRFVGIDVGNLLERFNIKTNYGVITGALYNFKFARVYFVNGIFMQVALGFFVYDILNKNRVRDYVYTAIILGGIFSSSTRGYWLGAIVVILLMLVMINKKQKIKLAKILVVLAVICSPILFTPMFKTEIIDRITSITDFSGDASNNVRAIQADFLMDKIKEKPLLGSGFGADLVEYQEETGLSGRSFELYYLELVYKTGVIGILILGAIVLSSFYFILKNVILNKRVLEKNREIMITLTAGCISALVTGITNPYFQGTVGIFIISLMMTAYFVINDDSKMISIKKIK